MIFFTKINNTKIQSAEFIATIIIFLFKKFYYIFLTAENINNINSFKIPKKI